MVGPPVVQLGRNDNAACRLASNPQCHPVVTSILCRTVSAWTQASTAPAFAQTVVHRHTPGEGPSTRYTPKRDQMLVIHVPTMRAHRTSPVHLAMRRARGRVFTP